MVRKFFRRSYEFLGDLVAVATTIIIYEECVRLPSIKKYTE
jgi:hypothetical protein